MSGRHDHSENQLPCTFCGKSVIAQNKSEDKQTPRKVQPHSGQTEVLHRAGESAASQL